MVAAVLMITAATVAIALYLAIIIVLLFVGGHSLEPKGKTTPKIPRSPPGQSWRVTGDYSLGLEGSFFITSMAKSWFLRTCTSSLLSLLPSS